MSSCIPVSLSLCLPVSLSLCLFGSRFVCPSVGLPGWLAAWLSVCPSVTFVVGVAAMNNSTLRRSQPAAPATVSPPQLDCCLAVSVSVCVCARLCVCVCVHPDSKLRALVNVSDCKAGGRGARTDSSANKAGLCAVRISLRTLGDVPAYGNGNQAKPQIWQAEGKGCMSVAANMLPGTCTVRAFRYTHPPQDLPRKV